MKILFYQQAQYIFQENTCDYVTNFLAIYNIACDILDHIRILGSGLELASNRG